MSDDGRHQTPGTDGWVDEPPQQEGPRPPLERPPVQHPQLPARHFDPSLPVHVERNEAEDGKTMALLSHASILLGVPLFIIPMIQRDNSFALHHGKAAAVNFIFLMVAVMVTVVTCGLAFPLIFFAYVPGIVGAVKAANGELAGTWGWGPTGEKMFRGLTVNEQKQLDQW